MCGLLGLGCGFVVSLVGSQWLWVDGCGLLVVDVGLLSLSLSLSLSQYLGALTSYLSYKEKAYTHGILVSSISLYKAPSPLFSKVREIF